MNALTTKLDWVTVAQEIDSKSLHAPYTQLELHNANLGILKVTGLALIFILGGALIAAAGFIVKDHSDFLSTLEAASLATAGLASVWASTSLTYQAWKLKQKIDADQKDANHPYLAECLNADKSEIDREIAFLERIKIGVGLDSKYLINKRADLIKRLSRSETHTSH